MKSDDTAAGPAHTVVLVGVNHKTAPVELRERFALDEPRLEVRLSDLISYEEIEEAAVISTCNRVEYYAVSGHPQAAMERLRSVLRGDLGDSLSDDALERAVYVHFQPESIEHLAAVAASLDSMVVGEAQVLGQVKRAYELAVRAKSVGKQLHALFQRTLSVAKTIRTVTEIAQRPVSISSVAVDLAKRILGDLSDNAVLLIGAGKMPEICLRHLRANGVQSIVVTNRTLAHAEKMATAWGARAVAIEHLEDELVNADIAISSTAAQHPILRVDQMRRVMARRHNRPLCVIDIAVPRDVEPAVNQIDNLYLFDIDSLQEIAGLNQAAREAEIERCRALIREEMRQFEHWQRSLRLEPAIKTLSDKLRRVGDEELRRLAPRLRDPEDQAVLRQLADRLIGKFLNYEIRHLRAGAELTDVQSQLDLARLAYELEEEP